MGKRCERKGHKLRTRKRVGYRPEGWPFVAREVEQTRKECTRWRCYHTTDWEDVDWGSGLHSLSLPSEWYRTMERTGFVSEHGGT